MLRTDLNVEEQDDEDVRIDYTVPRAKRHSNL